jgi:hypothetical protein
MVGYGYVYVGSTDLGSKSQSTVRTKLCVSLDDRLHGPSQVLLRDDTGTLWSEASYRQYMNESLLKENLENADSIVKKIIENIAMAVVVRSTDAELPGQDALKYLYNNTASPAGHIENRTTDLGVVYMVVSGSSDAFLEWMERVTADADHRFVPLLKELRDSSTGVAKKVCVKLLNDRRRLEFGPLELVYLKHVLEIGDPLQITKDLVLSMLRNQDEKYNGLRECDSELREKEEQERRRRAALYAQKRLEKNQKEDENRKLRVPIIELALLGWGNRREPLGQEQLKYLLDDLTKTGYTPREYITRDRTSSAAVSQQKLAMTGDGAAFLEMLLTEFSNIGKEVAELRRRLKQRACNAILARDTTFDVLVADYLTHVEKVVGFRADDDAKVDQAGLDALYKSQFAKKCIQLQKKRDAKNGDMALGSGEGAGAMDDDSENPFGRGPLRAVDAGGGGGALSDDGSEGLPGLGTLVAVPDDGVRPDIRDLPDVPGFD